ncbi:MAG: hypothetical protein V3V08_23185 [Nannocystaceae bacterium]
MSYGPAPEDVEVTCAWEQAWAVVKYITPEEHREFIDKYDSLTALQMLEQTTSVMDIYDPESVERFVKTAREQGVHPVQILGTILGVGATLDICSAMSAAYPVKLEDLVNG